MSKNIEINKAYIITRTEWESARFTVMHAHGVRSLDTALFESHCEKNGINPTWNRYKIWLKKQRKEIEEFTYEGEVKELVALYEKEKISTPERKD